MSREIKFRLYREKDNTMLDWDDLNDDILTCICNIFSFPNMDIPMQYTGLKDRNGKEIYENPEPMRNNDDEEVQQVS